MAFDSDNHNVKCPYYHRADSTKIYCEGVCPNASVVNVFKDENSFRIFRKKYCYTLGYGECPLAMGLNRHYENQ